MKLLLGALSALLCCSLSSSQTLDPAGKNICHNIRDPSTLVCCTGWRQEGTECTLPVCEGEQACLKEEICVYPGACRCPPGYFGAHCKTRCPGEFWAADCRKVCECFPHGRCHPVTGECTCNPNRWGPLCQSPCKCVRHGHCHPVHGNCSCDEGWWTATCSKPCQCGSAGSAGPGCDQLTGRCQCNRGHWGLKCPVACNCYLSQSPVTRTLDSACASRGTRGSTATSPVKLGNTAVAVKGVVGSAETTGPARTLTAPVTPVSPAGTGHDATGRARLVPMVTAAWRSVHAAGTTNPCDPKTGNCWRCDPGCTGPRCEEACTNRTFGDACGFLCSPCFHGDCHQVTGRCDCQPGFTGESCNSSCPALQFGFNCSSACDCGEGGGCDPVTGVCPTSGRAAVIAGVLVPLLLLLLAVLCCCLCCGGAPAGGKDRATMAEGGWSVRMKYHVYSVLANIGAALPCISDWSSGLPRVTVSHHDPELTFNHSFIEPPSSGWVTEGSSFDSDEEEEGEALYCVPPREDFPSVAGGEFHEMSSKCNMFMDPSGFSCEDITSPFNIPRTSSIAKSKRPSVSFAEGTRFSPKERRGSAQDPASLPGHLRNKPKSPWGVLMLSALQSQGSASKTAQEDGAEDHEGDDDGDVQETEYEETNYDAEDQEVDRTASRTTLQVPGASGRRRTMSNTAAHKGTQLLTPASDAQGGVLNKVTTVYVTVGKAGRLVSKTETSSEGPVQAMLRRIGSLQRQREQEVGRPKPKGAEAIVKPPRRKLGARASVWEEGAPPAGEVGICKPIRRKHASVNTPDTAGANDTSSESGSPKRPLSILKSVPELALADSGSDLRAEGSDATSGKTEGPYLTVGAAGDAESLTEVIANEGAVVSVNDEPCYENVIIKHT
ncbi:hypothetical protein CgunFtcFv8_010539 [Champsocephalus gunnari]|uniref:EGF-like domain-containing protein n=1 Tax=Champsocephalus gunnari TaxID=52237 RepID=A0AAN8HUN9_CHAGU|nr:hypothetical protein CgunFtcFv8_010539 [Champsocephalus gunnari]